MLAIDRCTTDRGVSTQRVVRTARLVASRYARVHERDDDTTLDSAALWF